MSGSAKQALIDALCSWPGVTVQPHRFGGIEFVWEGMEIGHLHGEHLVDLLLPKSMRDRFLAEGRAQPHHIYPDSGWVSVYLTAEEDVVNAIELLRHKYAHMVGKREGGQRN